ncbi:riboflavin synthase [Psychrobium sp. 1_MG-2023]|uniref:riboflavin synthase n=1 Tax=Psychrobium sp. 1_MG-2023 TaxID=3062624 RepID=UPI000C32ED8D|nr:riboflavin synthase [Psychrobium sp. 1_MG-2023]MDP2561818.1 riboflavin synthase [Psychrobium sp. 1_MG-2023]PKF55809.1 riboflavin synthase [Alteromonadales bacterium alter-6D02]
MFTGIIEAVGTLTQLKQQGGDYHVEIQTNSLDISDVKLGDSIASNGVCLTVVTLNKDSFCADVSNETVSLTGFTHYKVGQSINLEKALTPTTRLGGHMVSGHVDGVGVVERIQANGRSTDYWISAPQELMKYIAYKGSISVDGISLTVNGLEDSSFRLTIVPHTSGETTISQFVVGSKVNLEVDQIARYLERLMLGNQSEQKKDISMDLLARSGFLK